MAIILLLLAILSSTLCASVQPIIPGENLWRMVSRIGFTTDIIESEMDIVLSQTERLVSTLDGLVTDFMSVTDVLASQIDSIDTSLASMGDSLGLHLSIIEQEIFSLQDIVTSDVDLVIDQLSIIESAVEQLSTNITSVSEVILNEISHVETVVLSVVESLRDCVIDIPVTQADFGLGTFTVSQSGVYTLCSDITMITANPAINVTAPNVVIDLNGHTLITDAVGIQISAQSNVKIYNGTIVANNGVGIQIDTGSTGIIVEDIATFNAGIVVDNSTAVTIRRYKGVGDGSSVLIVNASLSVIVSESSVAGLTIIGIPGTGFLVDSSTEIVCDRCVSQGNVTGFAILNDSSSVVLRDCCANDAVQYGFICLNLSVGGPLLERCTADLSGIGAFVIDTGVSGGEWVECTASHSTTGFSLSGTNQVLKRCIIANNTTGISIQNTALNEAIFDTCSVNNAVNIVDLGSNTVFINLATVEDVLLSEIDALTRCTCSAIGTFVSALDNASHFIFSVNDSSSSVIEEVRDCLIGKSIANTDLPLIISAPGVYTVCEPLTYAGTPASVPAITIASNGVVLDLNGYTLTTTTVSRGIECHGRTNVSICNGTIVSGLESILVDSISQSITLSDLVLHQPSNVAIRINSCFGVTIENCVCNGNNGNASGVVSPAAIHITSSGGVLVKSCVVNGINAGTPVRGIAVIESGLGGVEIQSCSVHRTTNEAFRISSAATPLNNVFLKNCLATESDGFLVTHTVGSSLGPILDSCIAENGVHGFFVTNTQATTLANCVASNNSNVGLWLDTTSSYNLVLRCSSQKNLTGFRMDGTNTTLRWCTAVGNTTMGFSVTATALSTVIDACLASRNGGAGMTDGGLATTIIVDSRSQSTATTVNPAYNLNQAADSTPVATIVRTS